LNNNPDHRIHQMTHKGQTVVHNRNQHQSYHRTDHLMWCHQHFHLPDNHQLGLSQQSCNRLQQEDFQVYMNHHCLLWLYIQFHFHPWLLRSIHLAVLHHFQDHLNYCHPRKLYRLHHIMVQNQNQRLSDHQTGLLRQIHRHFHLPDSHRKDRLLLQYNHRHQQDVLPGRNHLQQWLL